MARVSLQNRRQAAVKSYIRKKRFGSGEDMDMAELVTAHEARSFRTVGLEDIGSTALILDGDVSDLAGLYVHFYKSITVAGNSFQGVDHYYKIESVNPANHELKLESPLTKAVSNSNAVSVVPMIGPASVLQLPQEDWSVLYFSVRTSYFRLTDGWLGWSNSDGGVGNGMWAKNGVGQALTGTFLSSESGYYWNMDVAPTFKVLRMYNSTIPSWYDLVLDPDTMKLSLSLGISGTTLGHGPLIESIMVVGWR